MTTRLYKAKRLLLGVLAALGVGFLLELVPTLSLTTPPFRLLDYFFVQPGIQSFFGLGLAMFVGAYVSRVNFVTTAIALTVISGIGSAFVLQAIVEPVEHVPLADVVAVNALNYALSLAGAIVGSVLGAKVYQQRFGRTPHAA